MSVDLEAWFGRPVTLGAVVDETRRVLTELLGGPLPEFAVIPDWPSGPVVARDLGASLDPIASRDPAALLDLGASRYRPLSPEEMAEIVIGQPIDGDEAHFFAIEVPAFLDGVKGMVNDFGEGDDPLLYGRHASITPCRTCVGVTVATGVALAVARVSGGLFIDNGPRLVPYEWHDPEQVISRHRLGASKDDFDVRCERFLRQFPQLNGWPRDRSVLAGQQRVADG